jgi:hypothetical protein
MVARGTTGETGLFVMATIFAPSLVSQLPQFYRCFGISWKRNEKHQGMSPEAIADSGGQSPVPVKYVHAGTDLSHHISEVVGQTTRGHGTNHADPIRLSHEIDTTIKIGGSNIPGQIDEVVDLVRQDPVKGGG